MGASDRLGGAVVVGGVGIAMVLVPAFDMWEDVANGKPLLSTVIENAPLVALSLGVVAGGVWLYRSGWRGEDVLTVTRWTVGNFAFALLLLALIVGIQLYVQNDLKPLVIAADAVVIGALGGLVLGVRTAQRERAKRNRFTALFDNLPNPVVSVENNDGVVVRNVNEAFVDVFGYERDHIVGKGLDTLVVPRDAEVDPLATDGTPGGDTAQWIRDTVRLETVRGRRDFVRLAAGETPDEQADYAIFIDVTEQKTHRERLDVLGRTLRHDIRNKVGIIIGEAELLGAAGDEQVAQRADRIIEAGTDLVEVSEETRTARRVVSGEPLRGTLDAIDIVESVVATVEQEYHCDIETDLPEAATIPGGNEFDLAVKELVENAVEHTGDPDPSVVVTLTESLNGDYYDLRVADEGPGIPPRQYEVVLGETERSQTTHPTGVGLWVANWIARNMGGELSFEENTPQGTVAVLRVPRIGARIEDDAAS